MLTTHVRGSPQIEASMALMQHRLHRISGAVNSTMNCQTERMVEGSDVVGIRCPTVLSDLLHKYV